MSDGTPRKAVTPTTWVLLTVLVLGAIGFALLTLGPSDAASREQMAEERAAALRDQSVKESPTPVTPDVVVHPDVPPTRGPMGSPPKR
ncbi:MAG: hypothetical protein RL689_44 [Planctomycetota bacterium]